MRSAPLTPRASGPLTSTSPAVASRALTSSTSATGPPAPAGIATRRRPRSPTTSSTKRVRSTSRPTSASPASRSAPGSSARRRDGGRAGTPHTGDPLMRARVLVKPKAGILDPQGQAVERALPALGFTGVRNVHVGRLIELDVEDPARLPEMCQRLLTNPLIEDYEIVEADAATGSNGAGIGSAAS